MKIASSTIRMNATHAEATRREVHESLRVWTGQRRPDFAGIDSAPPRSVVVEVSAAARSIQSAETARELDNDTADAMPPRLQLIKAMVEMLTGRRIRLLTTEDLGKKVESPDLPGPHSTSTQQNADWGIEYDYHESLHETEHTTYATEGVIRTTDGHEIRFALTLEMDRSWYEESSISLRAGNAPSKDPLVLNFDGQAVELLATRMRFDLDGDGTPEEIALLGSGSAYLALDLDGDGRITSGRELFGPQSGNGYAELERYDADDNRWIDENDPIFEKLRIWSPNADGGGTLETLQARNIGALSLDHLATPFALRAPDNASLGAVRSSGIYLTDAGQVGTMQQIDLTV